jgi:glucokinase
MSHDTSVLVGDVGGTHARLALADSTLALREVRVYPSAEFTSGVQLVERYRRDVAVGELQGCCLAIAGPVSGGRARLTNGRILCDAAEVAAALSVGPSFVINDFGAVGYALPMLDATALATIGPELSGTGTLAALGPGTGLGMGFVVAERGRWRVLPSEGGHANFAATDPLEAEVLGILLQRFDFVGWETVLSGPGLVNLYRAVCDVWGCSAEVAAPSEITARALEVTDPVCHQTLQMFCNLLGTAAGSLAVTVCATGGVYLAGGILPHLRTFLAESQFRRRFEARGTSSAYVAAIPTRLVIEPELGLLGAAAAFRELTESSTR